MGRQHECRLVPGKAPYRNDARGQAIAFLPAEARHAYTRRGVAYVDVIDLPPSTAALTWLPRHDNPALTALLQAAHTVVRRAGHDWAKGRPDSASSGV
ncbi:hypothetical protein ACTMSW_18660 [Micromonospora sp. BQ11]|uniref:hypothetical protein n=1 Tax=Micromonospora sp. BQ11 TaxID=3452212 RepID=UPI003F8AD971